MNPTQMTLLTPREMAMRLQVSKEQLDEAVRSGEIPTTFVGGQRRFHLGDVMAALRGKNTENK